MVNQLLGYLVVLTIVLKAGILLLQLLAMLINIAQIGIDDDALGSQLAMILSVFQCVEWHEIVRHDATSAIHHTMLLQRIILEGVSKMNTISTHQFTTLQTIIDIHLIVFLLTFLVRFLDAATRGREIVGNGQTNHRAVRQVDGTLNQSLAEGATSNDNTTIMILNGTRHDFSRRGRIAVNQYDNLSFLEQAITFGLIFHTFHSTSFSINNERILLQQFAGNVDSSLQITTTILL